MRRGGSGCERAMSPKRKTMVKRRAPRHVTSRHAQRAWREIRSCAAALRRPAAACEDDASYMPVKLWPRAGDQSRERMAPVKIRYVVSFTSEDRSRQLKAELQLERACLVGYIDVGNCGAAFLQIDVGRSSWPRDQPYRTLLPATALMAPADAKLDKNRSGVRMFKEGDFLASARAEKWDRVRLTCSQPFNKHAQFGLAFVHVRTPLGPEDGKAALAAASQVPPELQSSPWLSNAAICRTYFPETAPGSEEDAVLSTRLQRLDPACSPEPRSPACRSRPARMVLKAASARKRAFPLSARVIEPGQAQGASRGPPAARPSPELPVRRERRRASRRRGASSGVERSPAVPSARPRNGSRRERIAEGQKGRPRNVEGDSEEEQEQDGSRPRGTSVGFGTCPICAGRFPTSLLPAHASGCGEAEAEASAASPSSSWDEPMEAWVPCPICQFSYAAADVESHASTCGEQEEASDGGWDGGGGSPARRLPRPQP